MYTFAVMCFVIPLWFQSLQAGLYPPNRRRRVGVHSDVSEGEQHTTDILGHGGGRYEIRDQRQ